MIASRVSSLAAESETNAATARCRPFGSVMMPMSLVAEVMPLRVPPVPVLCATTVPAGNSPLRGGELGSDLQGVLLKGFEARGDLDRLVKRRWEFENAECRLRLE